MGTGRMAQAIERLPSKCEALNSNPSTTPPNPPKNETHKNNKNGLVGVGENFLKIYFLPVLEAESLKPQC
jgi:hypothetical protein